MDTSRMDRLINRRVGRSGQFLPLDGDPVDDVHVIPGDIETVEEYQVSIVDGGALFSVLVEEVGKPSKGDRFVVDGTTWSVVRRIYTNDPTRVPVIVKKVTA